MKSNLNFETIYSLHIFCNILSMYLYSVIISLFTLSVSPTRKCFSSIILEVEDVSRHVYLHLLLVMLLVPTS